MISLDSQWNIHAEFQIVQRRHKLLRLKLNWLDIRPTSDLYSKYKSNLPTRAMPVNLGLEENMSDADLNRVKEDLAIVKQAMGMHSSHQPQQLWANLSLAGLGLIIAAVTAFTGIAAQPVVQGSVAHLGYVALIVGPFLIAFLIMATFARSERSTAVLPWLEYRRSLVAAAVAVPVFIGFVIWAARHGMSVSTITAATLFLAGLFPLLSVLVDPRRLYIFGWALSTMLAGIIAPLCSYQSAGILAGVWLFCGGLSTAGIMAWQAKYSGVQNAN
jgi:hypothetical protein